MGFAGEHFIFRAAGTLAFLAADFFDLGALLSDEAVFPFFKFVKQQAISATRPTAPSLPI
jgi:hypothetical protein